MPSSDASERDQTETSVLRSIHDAHPNQWNNLVTQAERGTLFHRHEWLAAVEQGFDFEPHHVVVAKDGNPVALLPNFVSELLLPNGVFDRLTSALGLSVMTSGEPGYGGPVIASDERANLERLLDTVDATCKRSVLFHRISTHDLGHIRYGRLLQSRGYEPSSGFALFLTDLTDGWDRIFESMDKERQKGIRQAHEQDHRVEMAPIGTDLDRTYDMYERNMERVGGDVVPKAFLEALAAHLDDRVRVCTAHVDGDVVGKYVFLLDTECSVLHHWLSAIPDRSCYDAYPSELLHERAIRWGIDQGFGRYSFDKVGSYFDNSVFRFKSKFGGRAVPLLRWEKGESRVTWPLFRYGRWKYRQRSL
jgi:predicted N-acyltransferase